jgi:hypothetical protein
MDIDNDKIDNAVLALLYLTLHEAGALPHSRTAARVGRSGELFGGQRSRRLDSKVSF